MSDILQPAGFRTGIKGKYRLQVLNSDGAIKKDTGWFDNIITNRGLDYVMSANAELNSRPGNLLRRCTVGTGSTAPAASNVNLAGTILGTVIQPGGINIGTWVFSTEWYLTYTETYNFAVGAVVGNVAEVGVGPNNFVTSPPYDDLFSRALVLDGGMMPTTITVLADEQLRVFYTMELYPDMAADDSYVVNISGTNYTIGLRPARLSQSNEARFGPNMIFATGGAFSNSAQAFSTQTLGAKTDIPSTTGGTFSDDTVTGLAYTLGNHFRDVTWPLSTAEANFAGGIGSVTFGNFWGKWQMSFTPKIPKTNLDILSLTFRQTIARI